MGWFSKNPKPNATVKQNWVEVDRSGYFYHHVNAMLAGGKHETFDQCKSLYFATHLAEIFTPIDLIAERVSSCQYDVYNKNTDKIVENLPESLIRLIKTPNPMHSGVELIYQIQFSELAAGCSYVLTKKPSSIKAKTYDRISNIWCLNPDNTYPMLKPTVPDPFLIKSQDELIDKFFTHWLVDQKLGVDEVNYNAITKQGDNLRTISPLMAVSRNINNLLAVYSARYNVYSKNGVSGIVYKDNKGANDISEQVNPATRQSILDDIANREGITGDKNFVGISSFPLGFIKTLGEIKNLEPFKETFADAMAIGGVYGVDKELLPKEQTTTFNNKKDTEKHFWQNTVKPYADEMAKTLTKVYYLPEDWEFRPNTENIEILQADRKTMLEADKIEIENLKILSELGINVKQKLEQWKS